MAICSQSSLWNSKIFWDGHVHLKAIDRDVSGTDAPCPVCAPSNQLLRQGVMQANSGVGELQLQRIVGVGRITRCVPRPPVERHISPPGRTHTLTPAITIPPDHIGLHHGHIGLHHDYTGLHHGHDHICLHQSHPGPPDHIGLHRFGNQTMAIFQTFHFSKTPGEGERVQILNRGMATCCERWLPLAPTIHLFSPFLLLPRKSLTFLEPLMCWEDCESSDHPLREAVASSGNTGNTLPLLVASTGARAQNPDGIEWNWEQRPGQ